MAASGNDPPEDQIAQSFNLMQYVDPIAEEFSAAPNVEEETFYSNAGDELAFPAQIAMKRNPVYPQSMYNPTQMFQHPAQPSNIGRHVAVSRNVQTHPLPNGDANYNKAKQVYRINRTTGEAVPIRSWSGIARPIGAQTPRDTRLMETQNTLYRSQQPAPYSPYAQSTSSSVYSNDDYTNEVMELVPKKSATPAFAPPPKTQSKKKLPAGAKKPCNCTKSMCLKLYCDCFANGDFCKDCNCKDCHNNVDHEAERSRAVKASLERNPNAFKPKIGTTAKGKSDIERLHQKGCHCKKSNCLKNYCECFEAKVPCTDRCKCCSCRNTEADRANRHDHQTKQMHQQAQISSAQQTPVAKGLLNGFNLSDDEAQSSNSVANPKAYPWFYLTDEVVEATALCLIARLEEAENKTEQEQLESLVLMEFARCLEQIIENTNLHPRRGDTSMRFTIPPLPTKPMSVNEDEDDDEDVTVEVE